MKNADDFFLQQAEPERSCLLALKTIIQQTEPTIQCALKYGMPVFVFRGKMMCYVWRHKKFRQPYIGFVDGNQLNHPELLQEKRARMKILLIDPLQDLPIDLINELLRQAMIIIQDKT